MGVVAFQAGMLVQGAVQVVIFAVLAAPIYGLVTRRNWARIYTAALLILFAIGILVGDGMMALQQQLVVVLIYGAIVAGLLIWNVASLMSQDVRQYFVLAAIK